MVPMHAKNRKGPSMNRTNSEHAPIESGGGPPHSKTLARWPHDPVFTTTTSGLREQLRRAALTAERH